MPSKDEKWPEILKYLPERLADPLGMIDAGIAAETEELRIRADKPLMLGLNGRDVCVSDNGALCGGNLALKPTASECQLIFESICRFSIYAMEEDLKYGFVTLPGGCRVGLSGRIVMDDGHIKMIAPCTGFNFRFARQFIGCAKELISHITEEGSVLSTLIISPPQMGKTTMLRDAVRIISDGIGIKGRKVCVVDERSEIAACIDGVPQNDVGARTDVLDGCPKSEGIIMALRALSPEVLATDELGGRADSFAVEEAANCGVAVLATAHGSKLDEIYRRPVLRQLYRMRAFDRYVILGGSRGKGTVEEIFDGKLNPLFQEGAAI